MAVKLNFIESTEEVEYWAAKVSSVLIDRNVVLQDKLNLTNRERTSLFPWRGQFSPELIEFLLSTHTDSDSIILDPFVGSGTTLFESARLSLACYGAEINPAAIQLARMAEFANLDKRCREEVLQKANRLFDMYVGPYLPNNLFAVSMKMPTAVELSSIVPKLLDKASSEYVFNLLTTSIMLAMGKTGSELKAEKFWEAYWRICNVLLEIPFSPKPCKVFVSDARQLPLTSRSIDLVITSPPYINVFNYHQNYRKAMELMGWEPLKVAPSEIGANRKHRSNRFLTVIQYCIDMAQVLHEIRRLLKPEGKVIIILGRESKVRGVSFMNGSLIAMLAIGGSGFQLSKWQERRFVNRFGTPIYEDILTLAPDYSMSLLEPKFYGRKIGLWALKEALNDAPNEEVKADIVHAIEHGAEVEPSPIQAWHSFKPWGN